MYLVLGMKTDIELDVMGNIQSLNLTWAEGMIGAIPVFENEEYAEKYASGLQVVEVELRKNDL